MSELLRFLLIYDHRAGKLVETPRVFRGDNEVEAALDAYDAAEEEYARRRDYVEVLLVGAESLDAVKVTHGRFFRGHDEMFEPLPTA